MLRPLWQFLRQAGSFLNQGSAYLCLIMFAGAFLLPERFLRQPGADNLYRAPRLYAAAGAAILKFTKKPTDLKIFHIFLIIFYLKLNKLRACPPAGAGRKAKRKQVLAGAFWGGLFFLPGTVFRKSGLSV